MHPRLTATAGSGNGGAAKEIAALFLRLGCTAFGGPAAHVAVMEAAVVTQRAWVSRSEFLDLLGMVQLLPGPNSTELAIHLGSARGGWRGGMLAGLCFVLPSVILVWMLASMTGAAAAQPLLAAVVWWLTPVLVAVLCEVLWRFGRQASERAGALIVMPVTVLAAIYLPSDLVVLLAGGVAAVAMSGVRDRAVPGSAAVMLGLISLAGVGTLVAQAPAVLDGVTPDLRALFLYFLRAGASVFGSGYVLLGILQHDLVEQRHWLSLPALTQASALAQLTPGPLFTTATAAGYVIAGNAGALVATLGIFAPAFVSVAVSAPLKRLVQRSAVSRALLDGVVIASVALLGRAVVGFGAPMRGWQWLVCLAAAVLLFVRRGLATVLLLAAVSAGVVAQLFHLFPP